MSAKLDCMADNSSKRVLQSGACSMKSTSPWLITAACVGVSCSVLGVVIVVAKPPADPPITLSYSETPIFLDQHENSVTAIAFSADGKTLATGAGYLRLWDAANGRLRSIHMNDATRGV